MRRVPSGLVAALAGSAVLLAACGSHAPHAPRAPVISAQDPYATSRAAASSQALALLNRLPAYPGSKLVSRAPYATSHWAPGSAAADGVAPVMGVVESPNLVDLYREWNAPGGPSVILSWVKAQAAAHGLKVVGFATGGGPVGAPAEGVAFGLQAGQGMTPGVQVSVKSTGGRDAVVRYDATVLWRPPRPTAEEIPAGVTSVRIEWVHGVPPGRNVTVTNYAAIARLARLINGLPTAAPVLRYCPADRGGELVLSFGVPGNRSVEVSDGDCALVQFGARGAFPPLSDPDNALWEAAVALARP